MSSSSQLSRRSSVLHPDLTHVVMTAEQIAGQVQRLGYEIAGDYAGRDLLLIGVLKGVVPFMSDLARAIPLPCAIDFLAISSYQGSHSAAGSVQILKDLELSAAGKDILVVEDIIDTGLTLHYLLRWLQQRGPASISVCTLLDRPGRRLVNLPIRYCGFNAPEEFIVGYGLDYLERYRHLPYIGLLRPEIYMPG